MRSGKKSSLCCPKDRLVRKGDVRRLMIAPAWWGSFSSCIPAAAGTISRPSWRPAARLAGGDSAIGPRPMSGPGFGEESCATWGSTTRSTSPVRWWTAPHFVPFLGGAYGAEPHGPPEERLQTPSDHRRQRPAPGPVHHPRQRPRRQKGHRAVGCDPACDRGARASTLSTGRLPWGPGLRLGGQHTPDREAWGGGSTRPAAGRHARLRAGALSLCGRADAGVVRTFPSSPSVLREVRQTPPGFSRSGRRSYLSQEMGCSSCMTPRF